MTIALSSVLQFVSIMFMIIAVACYFFSCGDIALKLEKQNDMLLATVGVQFISWVFLAISFFV